MMPGHAGQPVRQQAALQRLRRGVLALEQRGPLQGQRALPGQGLQEDPLLLGDLPRLGEREPQRAQGCARREQRQPDPGPLVAVREEQIDAVQPVEVPPQRLGVLHQHRPPGRDGQGHHARRVQRHVAGRGAGDFRQPERVDRVQLQPLPVEQGHRRPLGTDRRAPDLSDHLDDLEHGQGLGQHGRGLLQPGGAQRGGGQLLGQPAAHLLSLALAGDIGAGPDPFNDLPVPLNRDGPHVVMPVRPGLGADPVTAVEYFPGADAFPPFPLHPLAVLRVNRVQPAIAQVLLQALAGNPAPLGRILGDLAGGRGHPDDLGARLHQRAVPLLAAADRLRRVLPVGHVHRDQGHAGDVPVRVVRGEPGERPLPVAVLAGPGASVSLARLLWALSCCLAPPTRPR